MTQQRVAGEVVPSFAEGQRARLLADKSPSPGPSVGARAAVIGLAASACALFGLAYTQPWWSFKLYAPQYPKGLTLIISLTGMGGDVHEIDLLNHYIGMASLAEAAPLERSLAGWGVAMICVLTLAGLLLAGRRLDKLVAIPAISFPIVFIADSFAWLYRFGHDLDPKAPIKLGAFTPEMFGNGQIGQFGTFAAPAVGFWLAVAGVVCTVAAALLRTRVCAGCARAKRCAFFCRHLVLPSSAGRGR